ncbi:hypothetical protein AVEN_42209-1 [Araneus ventricosus]|uniref:Uncharacterized protein n=1 Tax=Araneus ventricosus TaxID=182803 RepID=A0A4Y2B0Y6_ARAVE|nr:hypothetical protein AVEN_42209-1 [Araneus ventricosus]
MLSDFPLKTDILSSLTPRSEEVSLNQNSVNSMNEGILTQSENWKHHQSRFHPYFTKFLPCTNNFMNYQKSLDSSGPPSDRLSGRWKGYYYNPLITPINAHPYGNFQYLYKDSVGNYSTVGNKSYFDLLRFNRMKKEGLLQQNKCTGDLITGESNLKVTPMRQFQDTDLYGEFQRTVLGNKDVKVTRNEIQKDNTYEMRRPTYCLYQDQGKNAKLATTSTHLNMGNIGINYAKHEKLNQIQNEMLNFNSHNHQMVNYRLTEKNLCQKETNSNNETFKVLNCNSVVKGSTSCSKRTSENENTQLNTTFEKKGKSAHSKESDTYRWRLQAMSNIKNGLNSDAYQNSQEFYKNLANDTNIHGNVNNYANKMANDMYSYQRITERENDAIYSERALAGTVNEILQNNGNANQIINIVNQNNSIKQSTEASNIIKRTNAENSFKANENRSKNINEINNIVLNCKTAACRKDFSPFKLKIVEPCSKIKENFKSKENISKIPKKISINYKVAESGNGFNHNIRTSTETSCKFNDSVNYLNGKEDTLNHFKRQTTESDSKDNEDAQHKNCARTTANSFNGYGSTLFERSIETHDYNEKVLNDGKNKKVILWNPAFERSIETHDYNGKVLNDGKNKKVILWNPAFPCRKESNPQVKTYQNDNKHQPGNIEFMPEIKRNRTNEKPFESVSSDLSKRDYKPSLFANNNQQCGEGFQNDKMLTSKSSCLGYGNLGIFCRKMQNGKNYQRRILEKNENVKQADRSKLKQQLLIRKINNSNLLQAVQSHAMNTAKLQRRRLPILRRKFLIKDLNNVDKNKATNPLALRTPSNCENPLGNEEYPLDQTEIKLLEKKTNIHDSTKCTRHMLKGDVAGNSENMEESTNAKTQESVPLIQDNENCSFHNLYKWIAVLQTFILELKAAKRNFSLDFPVKKQISEEDLSSEFENEVYLAVFKQMGLSCPLQCMNPLNLKIPGNSA